MAQMEATPGARPAAEYSTGARLGVSLAADCEGGCGAEPASADSCETRVNFCSACGEFLGQSHSGARGAHVECSHCGTIHYSNPKILVACIAYYGHRLVMCRRALEPGRGRWSIPAGYMERGETIERAAAREAAEEVGIVLQPEALELYAILSLPAMDQVYVTLRTELSEPPRLRCGPESLEVGLFAESDVIADEWAFASTLVSNSAATLFHEIRTGRFGIHKMLVEANLGKHGEMRTYWLVDGKPQQWLG
jgi:ADP-ribose pyrophosphatase YjhB (NUDIX family)